MGFDVNGACEARLSAYVEELAEVMEHAARKKPLRDYCTGLMMGDGRKSVEPIAALTAPERTAAQHQSLLHFIGNGAWSDDDVLAKVRALVLPALERHGGIEAWIIDDTGFPKQGRHSVGVARQYCGQLGKQDNCQVAVSLSLANHHASLPVAYRLYLPKDWAADDARRRKAGVPEDIVFQTKPQIALEQIRSAHKAGLLRGVGVFDAGYGHDAKLRSAVTALGLTYVAGIQSTTLVWTPGAAPARVAKRGRRGEPRLVSAKQLAGDLPKHAWRTITWREGSNTKLSSRFARVRVRPGQRNAGTADRPEEWLLIEWPEGETAPTKYWLSTLPETISFRALVDYAKLRWRIERDYQDLKQEVGLGHFEGRGWRGFHHHATLCIAAYGFLISERERIPPSGLPRSGRIAQPAVSQNYRPRGAAAAHPAPRPELDRHHATAPDRSSRQDPSALPLLRNDAIQASAA
jgi:SRSO17 transposase